MTGKNGPPKRDRRASCEYRPGGCCRSQSLERTDQNTHALPDPTDHRIVVPVALPRKFDRSTSYTDGRAWLGLMRNGEGRIRTSEGVCRQIYSLLPLATRALLHDCPSTTAQAGCDYTKTLPFQSNAKWLRRFPQPRPEILMRPMSDFQCRPTTKAVTTRKSLTKTGCQLLTYNRKPLLRHRARKSSNLTFADCAPCVGFVPVCMVVQCCQEVV